MKVLVTGASGAVGPALVDVLLQESSAVRVLTRKLPPHDLFPGTVECIQGDICDADTVDRVVEGVDVVYHLAAKTHRVESARDLETAYQHHNIEGTRNLVQAAQSKGISRFVFFSTISVYGPGRNTEVVDETSPLNPQSLYTDSKYKAEKIVLKARKGSGEEHLGTVLRLAAVYGPRMQGNYVSLVKAVQSGRFIPIGTGQNRRTLVYDRDAARAAVLAASHPRAAGQVFNVTDGRIHALSEILAVIYEASGRRRPKYYFPAKPARLAAGLVEFALNLVRIKSPIQRVHIDKFTEDVAVSGEKIQTQLGFQPRFDLRQGWQETVQTFNSIKER